VSALRADFAARLDAILAETATRSAAEKELGRAIATTRRDPGRQVVCIAHIQPDADALGSALAMAYAIRSSGGQACVSFDPGPLPFGLPPGLGFLPGAELLVAPDTLPDRPVMTVVFDTSSAERLGVLETYLDRGPTLVVDHHARGAAFGDHRLIDARAAATCEIVAEIILEELGVELDQAIATCLYAGLAADTGSFRYAATSSASHELAARLLEAGARQDVISTALWDTRPAGYLVVLGAALGRVRRDGELIWTTVTAADLAAAQATAEEAEGVIDVIRVVPDHDVAVVLKEDGAAGTWKVSVRSRGASDVGAACAALGGGGHRLAAGFSAGGSPEQVVELLRSALRKAASPRR
jgi:bifunctional oligoribonuclease and PAP phosphatase NrnA